MSQKDVTDNGNIDLTLEGRVGSESGSPINPNPRI